MRVFKDRELKEALAWAATGEQALHLHKIIVNRKKAPQCFVRAVDKGEYIAHLFDQDKQRLEETARDLGVRVILIEREGTPSQHIDLCGKPLREARFLCEEPANVA
jgi:hypothetical protein